MSFVTIKRLSIFSDARASFMSGQLPRRTRVYDNAAEFASDIPTYAHHLRRDRDHEHRQCRRVAVIPAPPLHLPRLAGIPRWKSAARTSRRQSMAKLACPVAANLGRILRRQARVRVEGAQVELAQRGPIVVAAQADVRKLAQAGDARAHLVQTALEERDEAEGVERLYERVAALEARKL